MHGPDGPLGLIPSLPRQVLPRSEVAAGFSTSKTPRTMRCTLCNTARAIHRDPSSPGASRARHAAAARRSQAAARRRSQVAAARGSVPTTMTLASRRSETS
eukprot:15232220-Heterocapsa_arctica.AAC.1